MTKSTRARYTLEFKEEAVRLVTGGERVTTVARNLGLSEQTLHNWIKRRFSHLFGMWGIIVSWGRISESCEWALHR